jgi:hypothetical protein
MPMKLVVSTVGDLANLGGSVNVLTPFRSHPGFVYFFLSFLKSSFLSARPPPWGLESFYLVPFRSGRVEFLKRW